MVNLGIDSIVWILVTLLDVWNPVILSDVWNHVVLSDGHHITIVTS